MFYQDDDGKEIVTADGNASAHFDILGVRKGIAQILSSFEYIEETIK